MGSGGVRPLIQSVRLVGESDLPLGVRIVTGGEGLLRLWAGGLIAVSEMQPEANALFHCGGIRTN